MRRKAKWVRDKIGSPTTRNSKVIDLNWKSTTKTTLVNLVRNIYVWNTGLWAKDDPTKNSWEQAVFLLDCTSPTVIGASLSQTTAEFYSDTYALSDELKSRLLSFYRLTPLVSYQEHNIVFADYCLSWIWDARLLFFGIVHLQTCTSRLLWGRRPTGLLSLISLKVGYCRLTDWKLSYPAKSIPSSW